MNILFTLLFTLESALKLSAFGWRVIYPAVVPAVVTLFYQLSYRCCCPLF
jgi:hypothetical protein